MRNQVLAMVSAVLLAACAVGPDYHRPQVATPDQFVGVDATQVSTQDVERDFWKQFNDEQLNELIERALVANHDIRIAASRLREER